MGNIFRFFLFSAITVFLVGCSFFNKEMSCEEILINSYEESSLNNFEKNKFKDLLENRYPQYDEMFASASRETNIEKNLLAAISFQESQWDPRAKSNMGVRGMMMVTLETAALVGVEKRLNPEQNIKGGAKYFSMLQNKNKIGPSEADKLSIVLASYNLGPTNIIKIAGQIDSNIENYEILSWNLNPGDIIVHHPLTLHGSSGNKSSKTRRRGLALRYIGDDVTWDDRPGTFIKNKKIQDILPSLSLKKGDSLTGDVFPLIWSR